MNLPTKCVCPDIFSQRSQSSQCSCKKLFLFLREHCNLPARRCVQRWEGIGDQSFTTEECVKRVNQPFYGNGGEIKRDEAVFGSVSGKHSCALVGFVCFICVIGPAAGQGGGSPCAALSAARRASRWMVLITQSLSSAAAGVQTFRSLSCCRFLHHTA